MKYDAILGRDFLNRHVNKIDWPDRTMELRRGGGKDTKTSKEANICSLLPNQECEGRLVKSVKLAPGSQKCVNIYPADNKLLSKWVMVSDNKLLLNLFIGQKLESATQGEIPCNIKNTSTTEWVVLKKDMAIATVKPVDLVDACTLTPSVIGGIYISCF